MTAKGKNRIKRIFVDFDGVVSKNSVVVILKFIHAFIARFISLPFETIENYFKATTCFPAGKSIELFFSSFGLSDVIPDFIREYNGLVCFEGEEITVEPDFSQFVDYCRTENIDLNILTAAGPDDIRLGLLAGTWCDRFGIMTLNGESKADARILARCLERNKADSRSSLLVDDSPNALLAASRLGMYAVMMINDVFTLRDYGNIKPYIHSAVGSFTDIMKMLEKSKTIRLSADKPLPDRKIESRVACRNFSCDSDRKPV